MNTTLYTKYEAQMDRACPHSYYPRPSLVRSSYLSLNGEWDFGIGKGEVYSEKILVPFPPESALSGISRGVKKDEYMYYKRVVTLPEGFLTDGKLILHFGAIDQEAEVYIGDKKIGERLGGYIPFEFDITDVVDSGSFTLRVICRDTLDKKYPYGKQTDNRGGMWYTPVSGIWQSVWLECVPEDYIKSIKVTPIDGGVRLNIKGGRVEKTLKIEGADKIEEAIKGEETGEVYTFEGDSIDIRPSEPHLWSPEDPYLYNFTIISGNDAVKSYFAIRVVDIREIDGKARICLNGEPYVFNGLLDQGYYPDGLFLPATMDGYLDDIRMAKSLGFNMLRKHIKIEPEIFYYLCDREGIAVFQDMINNSDYSFFRDTALPTVGLQKLGDIRAHKNPVSRRIFEETMYECVEILYNHPSVVYYTIFNEGWGQFSADEMYEKLTRVDHTRIIDATSGWFRRTKSDVDSRHIYFKPLKPRGLDDRPLVISEFGGYSYRVEGHLYGEGNYGYKQFKTREEFEDALIRLYENEVLPLAIAGAGAFVYTQVSDVEDETNGLVTYDREVIKVDAERVRQVIAKCSGNIK